MTLIKDLTDEINTGLILVSKKGFLSANKTAKDTLGWDLDSLNENFSNLRALSENLSGFSKLLNLVLSGENDVDLISRPKRFETKIEGQYFNVYVTKLDDKYLLELSTIIYQDMNQTTHELKRPIQNIKTLVETLIMGAKNDAAKLDDYLSKLNEEADRLGVMVSDMLSLSHVINGMVDLNLVNIDLKQRIDKIFELLENKAKKRNIILLNKVDSSLKLNADVKLLDHLLTNLVDNAIKYNKDSGTVTVEADKNQINISDTGLGMTKEDAARVFDQFYRIKDRTHIQGTGLGLSIVKAIVELHGWSIEISSEPGQGTSFIINF